MPSSQGPLNFSLQKGKNERKENGKEGQERRRKERRGKENGQLWPYFLSSMYVNCLVYYGFFFFCFLKCIGLVRRHKMKCILTFKNNAIKHNTKHVL